MFRNLVPSWIALQPPEIVFLSFFEVYYKLSPTKKLTNIRCPSKQYKKIQILINTEMYLILLKLDSSGRFFMSTIYLLTYQYNRF